MSEKQADLREYETGVIGVTMLDWDAAQALKPRLSADEIADNQCRRCWEIFCHSMNRDEYWESLGHVGLVAFASSCMETPLPIASAPWMANQIKRASLRRRLREGVSQVLEGQDDPLEGLKLLLEGEERRMVDPGENELPQRLHEETMAEIRKNDLSSRISTGISSIDKIVQGFRLGNISVLGAEPSSGKTALALNVAVASLVRKKRVLVFSLEMSRVQMMDRMISSVSGIPYSLINNKRLNEEQMGLFEITSYSLTNEKNLYIYDTVYNVEQMGSIIGSVKPDLVIVDFLQFCRTTEKTQNTADKLEYIVSEFKRLAKVSYHTCHVMLLSQPSRVATREGQSMFALKGSSGIEQGGDVILLLDRPCVRDMTYPPQQAQIKIAKNKFGSTGVVDLYFDGEFQRFRDLVPGERFLRIDPKEEKPW